MKLPLLALLATALLVVQTLAASVPAAIPYPNQYIITLNPTTDKASFDRALSAEVARENSQERTGTDFIESSITRHFDISDEFKGYAGQFSPSLVAKLKKSGKVAAVEPVGTVYASGSQSGAPWGLVRISERALDLTKPYTYPDSAGAGVDVYVVDTGFYTAHPDFGGRARWGTTTCDGCIDKDENGHGTHVAGTIGSTTYGVAKRANLIAVKVLGANGSGSTVGVIAGINWVTAQAKAKNKTIVANLSLGGTFSAALNNAVKAATSAGVVFVVAAGGDNSGACNTSPASEPSAITVAATTKTDARASSSNYGTCIDIFAPGTAITSTWKNGGTNTLSGTSMAAAHVVGVAALLSAGTGSPDKLTYVKQ
ncbi:hypothetical protein AMAG_14617 [Allomyces macrogynus ATCC 38327]|uniref:Peptidase S8/S53 domain-containing protein n=1 Tax=Allomyces macrogynus (strain ATCC 38327) TaxID=578462 RepID=A0A0L0T6U3_ALLM3|nr:hypothetical protein AMAG_14617 [Allomyces macrogynus ATCC 38327]|eukprot:KNE70493.1 hypothetical protein AMAG_14617 [Allomyces macrogynus ATCC 38327]